MNTSISINLVWLIYIIVMIGGLFYATTRDSRCHDYFGSKRDWAELIYIIFAVVFTLIWGGIFWW